MCSLDVLIMDVLDPGAGVAVTASERDRQQNNPELWVSDHKHVVFSNPLFKTEFYQARLRAWGVVLSARPLTFVCFAAGAPQARPQLRRAHVQHGRGEPARSDQRAP